VFQEEEDFGYFKNLLGRTKKQYAYQIYHYCVMNTHFHLAVAMDRLIEFSKALKEIKEGYTRWFRRKYGGDGPLWRGRFGSQLIENETYLLACGLYIESNPVRAGMVQKAEDWLHSSSRHYLLGQCDRLVDPYDVPAREKAEQASHGIDFQRGRAIGSKLFVLHVQQNTLQD